jgi:hypothetical protein
MPPLQGSDFVDRNGSKIIYHVIVSYYQHAVPLQHHGILMMHRAIIAASDAQTNANYALSPRRLATTCRSCSARASHFCASVEMAG